jgi:hypothetical protein
LGIEKSSSPWEEMMYYLKQPLCLWSVFTPQENALCKKEEKLACFFVGAKSLPILKYRQVKSFVNRPKWNMWHGIEIDDYNKNKLLWAMGQWLRDMDIRWGKDFSLIDKLIALWKEW